MVQNLAERGCPLLSVFESRTQFLMFLFLYGFARIVIKLIVNIVAVVARARVAAAMVVSKSRRLLPFWRSCWLQLLPVTLLMSLLPLLLLFMSFLLSTFAAVLLMQLSPSYPSMDAQKTRFLDRGGQPS